MKTDEMIIKTSDGLGEYGSLKFNKKLILLV